MDYLESISKAVSNGETDSQFAIPDGKYLGDLFFITDKDNKILVALQWTGDRWMNEFEKINVQE